MLSNIHVNIHINIQLMLSNIHINIHIKIQLMLRNIHITRAAELIQRPWGKRESRGPFRASTAVNFRGLVVDFANLQLVYFLRPPDLEA